MKFSTYFDRKSWFKSKGTINKEESLTDQSFKSMCEIEQLLVNYRGTPRTPVYDLNNYETSNWSFEDWQNEKAKIERKFLHLDEKTRQQFGNAQNFFRYCSNPDNWNTEKPVEVPTVSTDIPPVEAPQVE